MTMINNAIVHAADLALPYALPANAAQQIASAIGQITAGSMFGQPGTIIQNMCD